jgi:D-3-phosphoglycerate dehydrogenase
VTPHAAFVSAESLDQMRRQAMEQIVQGLRGERPNNLINPQIESIRYAKSGR